MTNDGNVGVVPKRLVARAQIAILSWLVGNLVIRMAVRGEWVPPAALLALAAASAVPLVVLAFSFARLVREELDEMLQRVLLEGLAFGLLFNLALVAIYMNVAAVGFGLARLDPPDLLFPPAAGVAVGIALAWRRFR